MIKFHQSVSGLQLNIIIDSVVEHRILSEGISISILQVSNHSTDSNLKALKMLEENEKRKENKYNFP